MIEPAAPFKSGSSVLERLAWWILASVALFHIVATLAFSLRAGRLARVPFYDDVSYLLDGLGRLKAYDAAGLWGILGSFLRDPPHAPITSLLASLGFALTPNEPLGAYALSGVWVLLVLGLIADMLRHLPSLTRVAVLCPLIAVPMLSTVVGLFRPDASWGLLTGCAAIGLAVIDLGHVSGRRLF